MENNEQNLTILEHLDELRQRIIYCLVYLCIGVVIGFLFAEKAVQILQIPARGHIDKFIFTKPTEGISIFLKIAAYLGVIISSPAIIYHAWQFIKSAFPGHSKLTLTVWITASLLLFALGTAFSFVILIPAGLNFLIGITMKIADPMITLNSYISFVLAIMILGGITFEMPVLAAMLVKAGILSPYLMRSKRREAIFILIVLAAILTPTTDIFNLAIFVIPLIILYEISIGVAHLVYKNKETDYSKQSRNN